MTERQRSAITAATSIAERHGATVSTRRLLRDSSFVTLQLSPTLLARVRIKSDGIGAVARVRRELLVTGFLSRHGAPVVYPTSEIPPGPHEQRDAAVTFWRFEKQTRGRAVDSPAAFRSLKACHDALASYRGRLPSFLADIRRCRSLLNGGHERRHMKAADYEFLLGALPVLLREMRRYSFREVALHGDSHLGNAMQTKRGVLWCDFESACRGPIEWDLASLPQQAAALYDVDYQLLELLRDLRSWIVASWCWMLYDRSPEKREAASYHLKRLRKRMPGRIRLR